MQRPDGKIAALLPPSATHENEPIPCYMILFDYSIQPCAVALMWVLVLIRQEATLTTGLPRQHPDYDQHCP
jgi:hypothetical protein